MWNEMESNRLSNFPPENGRPIFQKKKKTSNSKGKFERCDQAAHSMIYQLEANETDMEWKNDLIFVVLF